MKTLLFTAFDDAFKPLAVLTVPRMAKYAAMRGFDFRCYTSALVGGDQGIYWTKIPGAIQALNEGYDRVIWLDVDQMVTHYSHGDWEKLEPKGFHVSKDWGVDAIHEFDFSACGFVAHQDCRLYLEHVLDLELESRGKAFPEQAPMRDMAEKMFPDLVTVWPRRFCNAVPDDVCPGRVVEPWQPGDWCAHLTMVPLETRVALFHTIASRL